MRFLENKVVEQHQNKLIHSHFKKKKRGILGILKLWFCSFGSASREKKHENILCLRSLLAFKNSDMKSYKLGALFTYPGGLGDQNISFMGQGGESWAYLVWRRNN